MHFSNSAVIFIAICLTLVSSYPTSQPKKGKKLDILFNIFPAYPFEAKKCENGCDLFPHYCEGQTRCAHDPVQCKFTCVPLDPPSKYLEAFAHLSGNTVESLPVTKSWFNNRLNRRRRSNRNP